MWKKELPAVMEKLDQYETPQQTLYRSIECDCKMKRILLDTNVYGKLVKDTFIFPLLLERKKRNDIVVYGTDVVRKELRAISKKVNQKQGFQNPNYMRYITFRDKLLKWGGI